MIDRADQTMEGKENEMGSRKKMRKRKKKKKKRRDEKTFLQVVTHFVIARLPLPLPPPNPMALLDVVDDDVHPLLAHDEVEKT